MTGDDRNVALMELARDRTYRYIVPERRLWYVDQALAIGREQARVCAERDVFALAAVLGAHIVVRTGSNEIAGVAVRAEYDAVERRITLYEVAIQALSERLRGHPSLSLPADTVAAIYTAHELFHHLEAVRIPPVDLQLPPVTIATIARIPVRTLRVARSREIAAHAFAKTLLRLTIWPALLDQAAIDAQCR